MRKESLILIGGGGHCKSCIDVINAEEKYDIRGILDLSLKVGEKILDYPILGTDNDIDKLNKQFNSFFISLGHLGSSAVRTKLFDRLKNLNISFKKRS